MYEHLLHQLAEKVLFLWIGFLLDLTQDDYLTSVLRHQLPEALFGEPHLILLALTLQLTGWFILPSR